MAHYNVTFACGHTEYINLLGKTAERERLIAYYEKSGECSDCYRENRKAREAKQNKAAGFELIEMHYGEYKDKYSECKTEYKSYNPATKTIKVWVPAEMEATEDTAAAEDTSDMELIEVPYDLIHSDYADCKVDYLSYNCATKTIKVWVPAEKEYIKEDEDMTNNIEFRADSISVDGNTVPCVYSYVRGDEVSIGAKDCISIETAHGTLPRDLFYVAADNYPNDNSGKDYSLLRQEHPLFSFARYAAAKSRAEFLKNRLADFKPIPCIDDSPQSVQRELDRLQSILSDDPGQPNADDLAATRTHIGPPTPCTGGRAVHKSAVDRMVESVFRRW